MIRISTGTTDGLQKITPEQKIQLAAQWETIAREYPIIINQAVLSGVKPTAEYRAYEASYAALDAYLHNTDKGILVHMDTLSFVEPGEYQKVWNTYYSDKAKLLLLVAVPPTNQVTDITLTATAQADKTINVTVTCKYTQGLFKATHIVLYRNSATSTPRPIDTVSAHTHVTPLLPNATDNHEYTITLNLPQVSGNVQLHYRFAITAAFLGSGALALHKDGVIDGGTDWHDVTVEQPPAGSLYNYWNYNTGELRAGKKDNYIRLNPETNELEHKGITIKVPQVEQRIAEFEALIQSKIDEVNNAARDRFIKESGQLGEIRYFTSKDYTYGFLYANGYAFVPELYPEYYQFWLVNFADPKKKNYLGYDRFGYPKLPDLRGTALRAVDDGAGRCGADMVLEYQGDAIRNITGNFGRVLSYDLGDTAPFYRHSHTQGEYWCASVAYQGYYSTLGFDASRVVPTADDNRVKSYAVYPFIKMI